LRSPLPAMRLLTWFHVAGNQPPQIIPEKLIHFSDFALCSSPYTADLPLFQNLPADLCQTKTGMVYDTTDFQRLGEINLRQHQGFNVGYIGTVDLVKMHPNYVPMSAKINIPQVKFIVCGHGNDHHLKYQAEQLGVSTKFDWRGYVEDIKSVIEILDIFGYPLCEDNYSTAELVLQEAMYAGVPPVISPTEVLLAQ
ncbi:MAG: glycosyltransferase, partial [Microcoleaceae cyanobacterium]